MDLKTELRELQRALGQVDLITRPRPARRNELEVVEIVLAPLGLLEVKMYQEAGHELPHVHINYGRRKHIASYSIDQGRRIVGKLDRKYDRAVSEWILANRQKLLDIWRRLQCGSDVSVTLGSLS